jgi:Tfp pilus assembly protein PilO
MKTKRSDGKWVLILAAAAAVAAYVYLLFLPQQRTIAGLRRELAAAEEFIQQVEAFGPALAATQQEVQRTRQYVHRWEESAPTEDELAEFFGRVSGLAKQSGATTTRFEPQEPVRYEKIRRLPVAITCSGSFDQICRFLQGLEHLEETVWVDSLKVEQSGEDKQSVECEVTLVVFADNSDDSDQADRSDFPISEETSHSEEALRWSRRHV